MKNINLKEEQARSDIPAIPCYSKWPRMRFFSLETNTYFSASCFSNVCSSKIYSENENERIYNLQFSICVVHDIQQARFDLKKNLRLFLTRIILFERKWKNSKEIPGKLCDFYPTSDTNDSILNFFSLFLTPLKKTKLNIRQKDNFH